MDFCKANKISWCSWSWCGKKAENNIEPPRTELSAALKYTGSYSSSYTYTESDLTETGRFIASKLQEGSNTSASDVKNIKFGIYPNPAKEGIFNVSLEDNTSTSITISNVQGKNVYTSIIESKDATINANLKTGTYIVSVKNENGTGSQKLIVE